MSGFLDVYSIIFLVLAVVILFKLRSVLGRRTGSERPPFDPYSQAPRQKGEGTQDTGEQGDTNDNVVSLPSRTEEDDEAGKTSLDRRLEKVAPAGSALNEALRAIISSDGSFDPRSFVEGAKSAYEMVVTAFAAGDRKTLKNLLSKEVYDGFVAAIADRESRKEAVAFTFVGIDKAEIVEATLKKSVAQVTVRFRSKIISATRNEDGAIIEGDPNQVVDVTDIWTFSRDVTQRDPNWKLVATETAD
ncbi:putative lipid-binding transport protein (Tim44 family) [Breoghania corrubedonensis]|uniref:Large ribosomal subunit protein mL45 n=1 Tax=Breoghania corrubedonensis TaxID=665038 RepID=A0A2T5VH60_9HYPH|nr:Tim44/TimA family putative adaptor protein [Breoghania corrubedonensis]PTW63101.1 putative lipid-binding transport protein (Tim44 family) [Breoghania corrubedonensis]